MTTKLKKIAFSAALLTAANLLYVGTARAFDDEVIAPCGGGCHSSATCYNNCGCFPMIGTPEPGVCTN